MNFKSPAFGLLLLVQCGSGFAESQPNVVIIYGDDVGYGDVGANGSEKIPTPNIDKLAASGRRFVDGHCSASTCTPSRYSMLTGVHAFRSKIRVLPPDGKLVIPTDILTLPKLFKKAGYDTAVIGKWHLGLGEKGVKLDWNAEVKPGPLEIGFDYSYLLPVTNDRVPCVYLDGYKVENLDPNDPIYIGSNIPKKHSSTTYPNGNKGANVEVKYQADKQHNNTIINKIARIGTMVGGKSALWTDETMADVFVEKTKKYIANRPKDKPFFLYFASQDIHVPRAPHERFEGKTDLGFRGDAMVQFDWSTGEIIKALEEAGLRENTIIIFSSDNGPVYDDGYEDGCEVRKATKESDHGHDGSGVYKGGKYSIFEGGTRVPFIVSWPGKIKPATSDALVNQIDFMASFAEMLELELADDEAKDSRNSWASLFGNEEVELKDTLVESPKLIALRDGQWKLIAEKFPKLFNLLEDPQESKDLAKKNPERVKKMMETLKKFKNPAGMRNVSSK